MKSCCYFWENSRKYKKITIKRMLARTFGVFFVRHRRHERLYSNHFFDFVVYLLNCCKKFFCIVSPFRQLLEESVYHFIDLLHGLHYFFFCVRYASACPFFSEYLDSRQSALLTHYYYHYASRKSVSRTCTMTVML